MTTLDSKLQLKQGQRVVVFGLPAGLSLDLPINSGPPAGDEAVLVFAQESGALSERKAALLDAAAAGRLTWVAYPKAGGLGTDLNRDILRDRLVEWGTRPVRQVALNDDWSALRVKAG